MTEMPVLLILAILILEGAHINHPWTVMMQTLATLVLVFLQLGVNMFQKIVMMVILVLRMDVLVVVVFPFP